MKYQKPQIIELSTRTLRTDGLARRLGCVSGGSADSIHETCGVGTGAQFSCFTGDSGGSVYTSCVPGGTATGADCLSGTVVTLICESGSSGSNDPYGCRVGPSFT